VEILRRRRPGIYPSLRGECARREWRTILLEIRYRVLSRKPGYSTEDIGEWIARPEA
jgi:hypothetical protein